MAEILQLTLRNIYSMKIKLIIDSFPINGRKNVRESYRKFARQMSNFLKGPGSRIIFSPHRLAPGKFSIKFSFKDDFILKGKKIETHCFFAQRLSHRDIKRIVLIAGAKQPDILDLIHYVCSMKSETSNGFLKDFNRPNIKIEFKVKVKEKKYILTHATSLPQVTKAKAPERRSKVAEEQKSPSTPRGLIKLSRELEKKYRIKGPESVVTDVLDWIGIARIEIGKYKQEIETKGWRRALVKQRALYVHLGIRLNLLQKLYKIKPEKIEIPEYS